jgi:CheY-like chemotaxis protein
MKQHPLVILFADPDLPSTRRLRAELRRRGARVHRGGSVEEVIHQAALAPPDLFVMDAGFSLQGDTPLGAFVQSAFPKAQIILLGRGDLPDGEETPRGILFHSRKPMAEGKLLEVIEEAFPGRLSPATHFWPHRGPILCVDDDPSYLRSLTRFLNRQGYPVAGFQNGPSALEALPRLHPELAILDLMMPGMDGLDLAERIRERSRGQVPIVFLSALDSDEAHYRGHETGGSYYLAKPCEPEKLINVVDYLAGDLDEEERNLLRPVL